MGSTGNQHQLNHQHQPRTSTGATLKTNRRAYSMKTSKTPNSIIYSGPSLIDGAPIVCIAITSSGNSKTGDMVQTHIIRADMDPRAASKTGADVSICGTCQHRGTPTADPAKATAQGRTCYVNLGQGPLQVFKAYSAGKYSSADRETIRSIGRGRMVRLGTYGDPAAVPAQVWADLLAEAAGHTGYTHQHQQNDPSTYNRMMYSADTAAEAAAAQRKGFRTFRVIPVKQWQDHGKAALMKTEALCPASAEAGRKATCIQCKLCTGSTSAAKSIAIVAHGTARKKVQG